jgi:hypothetical protein
MSADGSAIPHLLLVPAAVLEVWGDYVIRSGLPSKWDRMALRALLLALYASSSTSSGVDGLASVLVVVAGLVIQFSTTPN